MGIKKNITEAKAQFSSLIDKVEKGETVTIGRAGRPVAKIVPFEKSDVVRKADLLKGKIQISDDFDELPPELKKFFGA